MDIEGYWTMTLKQYNEVHNFAVQRLYGKCHTMNRYTTNMLNIACIYICSLYYLMKSMGNDIEYNMNGYEYGFVIKCQTNSSCNSITKYQNI